MGAGCDATSRALTTVLLLQQNQLALSFSSFRRCIFSQLHSFELSRVDDRPATALVPTSGHGPEARQCRCGVRHW
ncbi:MAG: hypothetical protein P4L81_06290, partial [Candidatus Pacebacteria bacterium]|nr:hypothetical protein [Candidatus Paceibacterota bacterium]